MSISLFWVDSLFASYTPGPTISLTGSTSDVRFDVAEPLFGTVYSGAYLDTATRNMSGAFYIQDIGWSLLSTGSYQVELDCGGQPLGNLTSQCQFSGSGWNENIGELGFSTVRYNPSTGTLSGYITSFFGDLDVDGVYLALHRALLVEPIVGLRTSHAIQYTIGNRESYVADNVWSMQIIPSKDLLYTRTIPGGISGIFAGVDISLADTYTFRITDPDGGVTRYSGIVVSPAVASNSLDTTAGLFVEGFCNSNALLCPDGSTRTATSLSTVDTIPQIADGADAYNYTLKLRDTYGNAITTGSVEVSYTGTVSAVQLPDNIVSSPYTVLEGLNDAIVINGFIYPLMYSNGLGSWMIDYTIIPPSGSIEYSIASIAPTDGADNRVVLDEIVYTATDGTELRITDSTELVFTPAYTIGITPPTSIIVGANNTFDTVFTTHTTALLSPEAIVLMHVGSGMLAYFDNLVSPIPLTEESRDTDWLIDLDSPSSITVTTPPSIFSFSGQYSVQVLPPISEVVQYYPLVHYITGGLDVVYPSGIGALLSEREVYPVKFLGQEVFSKEQNSARIRTDMYNKIRKNTALLSRNRSSTDDYSDAQYTIHSGDQTVDNTVFDTKETIITIGGDITIDTNIAKRDIPLAIIALADSDGNGGDIIIDEVVTDIAASLFPEHGLMSTGTNQLYIHGSLVSANTLGGSSSGICPYYVGACTDPSLYDLATIRSYTGTIGISSAASVALKYPTTALIIDYDMRVLIDPPAGFPQ